ncbi:HipA domain-containing protein [Candidatus Poriferisodalis sp.]|uniref:HipA domain-containing protein n=1 Tax=Candidatus Poriferisodalis sp. TaxID=3101277 RepID=UPI003B02B282
MTADLTVLMHGRITGHITKGRRNAAKLHYEKQYADDHGQTPLSLAFPLRMPEHDVGDWLDGLLPPLLDLRREIGRAHGAASQHPVDLLATEIGADCAGAVQFCRPENAESVLERRSGVTPMDETAMERSLHALRRGAVAWEQEVGQPLSFSLSGAQTKVAIHKSPEGTWGVPYGNTPSTHIVKIALPSFDSNDVVEHVCMSALRDVGIDAAETEIVEAGGERAIAVRRFDRRIDAGGVLRRVHQEDMCQATGTPSDRKYQWDGGPSPAVTADLLRGESQQAHLDISRFRDALLANWILLAPDAHAKNYSVQLRGYLVRFAPLYDICSMAPWRDDEALQYLQMAMKSGESYDAYSMRLDEWQSCAMALKLPAADLLERMDELASSLPKAVIKQAEMLPAHLNAIEPVERLADIMSTRERECGSLLSPRATGAALQEVETAVDEAITGASSNQPANTSSHCQHIGVRSRRQCILKHPHPGQPHRYSR